MLIFKIINFKPVILTELFYSNGGVDKSTMLICTSDSSESVVLRAGCWIQEEAVNKCILKGKINE